MSDIEPGPYRVQGNGLVTLPKVVREAIEVETGEDRVEYHVNFGNGQVSVEVRKAD